jgi:predicted AAA+ superfamily ATPase
LNIETREALLSHMVLGASWEGYCIETLLACAPKGVTGYFYRTGGGAEIDLLLTWPGGELWAIEIKRSSAPKVERGFHSACHDLNPSHKWVVYPGQESYPISADIQAISLPGLCERMNMG